MQILGVMLPSACPGLSVLLKYLINGQVRWGTPLRNTAAYCSSVRMLLGAAEGRSADRLEARLGIDSV